eukprot:CAMPEP_0119125582 /NCGR_PEP_ID=MMETSP1310-20130426/4806_1 /TAXON_ID=464262 /ORGANISM="Genus nov. species nov., Strain RCC2339" /LENGTH=788 /DNA_ID=CAMNT_0007115663 /DNA_START=1 /DNA_END=2370 /DNA_ORIENTATION=-
MYKAVFRLATSPSPPRTPAEGAAGSDEAWEKALARHALTRMGLYDRPNLQPIACGFILDELSRCPVSESVGVDLVEFIRGVFETYSVFDGAVVGEILVRLAKLLEGCASRGGDWENVDNILGLAVTILGRLVRSRAPPDRGIVTCLLSAVLAVLPEHGAECEVVFGKVAKLGVIADCGSAAFVVEPSGGDEAGDEGSDERKRKRAKVIKKLTWLDHLLSQLVSWQKMDKRGAANRNRLLFILFSTYAEHVEGSWRGEFVLRKKTCKFLAKLRKENVDADPVLQLVRDLGSVTEHLTSADGKTKSPSMLYTFRPYFETWALQERLSSEDVIVMNLVAKASSILSRLEDQASKHEPQNGLLVNTFAKLLAKVTTLSSPKDQRDVVACISGVLRAMARASPDGALGPLLEASWKLAAVGVGQDASLCSRIVHLLALEAFVSEGRSSITAETLSGFLGEALLPASTPAGGAGVGALTTPLLEVLAERTSFHHITAKLPFSVSHVCTLADQRKPSVSATEEPDLALARCDDVNVRVMVCTVLATSPTANLALSPQDVGMILRTLLETVSPHIRQLCQNDGKSGDDAAAEGGGYDLFPHVALPFVYLYSDPGLTARHSSTMTPVRMPGDGVTMATYHSVALAYYRVYHVLYELIRRRLVVAAGSMPLVVTLLRALFFAIFDIAQIGSFVPGDVSDSLLLCAQSLARLYAALAKEPNLCRNYVMYIVVDHVFAPRSRHLPLSVGEILKSGLFDLFAVYSAPHFASVHRAVGDAGGERFKRLVAEYESKHKYSGKS